MQVRVLPRAFMSRSILLTVAALLLGAGASAQDPEPRGATPDVFRRFAARVVKLEVSETGSGAKATLGSGFFVTPAGHLVTNYHVVAKLVQDPDRYTVELVDQAGARLAVRVLAVDVVHDLAVVATDRAAPAWFRLGPARLEQGSRLFALGHPRDLGLSIVEGTYNGLLRHTLYPRIHFTGSLNPGMSGGPTITGAGDVVGINVATAGNQVSFLVPAEQAAALVARATAPGELPAVDLAEVGRQIREYQDVYVATLFSDSLPTVTLGPWRLPTRPAPFFNCWADAERDDETPYERVDHDCSTDDLLFVSPEHSTGIVRFDHRLLTSERLNPFQFASLYTDEFQRSQWVSEASADDVTPFSCKRNNVRGGAITFKTEFCLRGYRRFPGLYDAVLRAAPLGRARAGVVTTLSLAGVSFENAQALARRYLGSITWAP